MAIRFNNGRGAITCDNCNVIIDEGLSEDDYEYYKTHPESHICMKCGDITKDDGEEEVSDG